VPSLLTSIDINNKKIVYKELKLKDYKSILKCLIGDSIDNKNLLLNLNQILKKITNLEFEKILNLNMIEYLLLLIHIRTVSIGSFIFGSYSNEKESIKVEISLYKAIKSLEDCLKNFKSISFKDKNITLTTTIPTIKQIMDNKPFLFFKEDINELPVKYIKHINQLTKKYNLYFNQYYFYNPSIEKFSIKIDLQPENYFQIIKMLFNENLITVYDNIYYLCKLARMSPEYLEKCTYGEFKIFIKKTEETFYKNTKQASDSTLQEPTYDPIDMNSLYGNDENTPISKSEFTP
jgi:hypothetical protein